MRKTTITILSALALLFPIGCSGMGDDDADDHDDDDGHDDDEKDDD